MTAGGGFVGARCWRTSSSVSTTCRSWGPRLPGCAPIQPSSASSRAAFIDGARCYPSLRVRCTRWAIGPAIIAPSCRSCVTGPAGSARAPSTSRSIDLSFSFTATTTGLASPSVRRIGRRFRALSYWSSRARAISWLSMPRMSSSARWWTSRREAYDPGVPQSLRPHLYLRHPLVQPHLAEWLGLDARAAGLPPDDLGDLRDARRVPAACRTRSGPQPESHLVHGLVEHRARGGDGGALRN